MGVISFFQNLSVDRTKIAILETSEELEIDFVQGESHSWASEVTRYPIEQGGIVSDHILNQPKSLRISGVVGDSPMNLIEVLQQISKPPKTVAAVKFFENLHEAQSVVTISTRLRTYSSMVCTSIDLQRGQSAGNSFSFDVTFEEAKFINTIVSKTSKTVGAAVDATGALKKEGPAAKPADLGKKSLEKPGPTLEVGYKTTWTEGPIPYEEAPPWAKPYYDEWTGPKPLNF